MGTMVAMASFCVVIVSFYSWFLISLCKDWKRQWFAYLLRLEHRADESEIADLPRKTGTWFHLREGGNGRTGFLQ
jgi:hypothetical protein